MKPKILDYKGLKCPQPTLRLTKDYMGIGRKKAIKDGDVVEIIADCSTFDDDIKKWCKRMSKTLVWIKDEGDRVKRAQVRF